MSISFKTPYPVNATNKYWQSKKSLGDKLVKARKVTGLGAKLTLAETKYKLIKFDLLDIQRVHKKRGGENFPLYERMNAKEVAIKHVGDEVYSARRAMEDAAEVADKLVANVGNVYSAATVTAAKAVAKALRDRAKELKEIDLNDFQNAQLG